MQKIKINIAGSDYNIMTNRDPKYVKTMVKKINDKITTYIDKNDAMTINHVFILLILEYMDSYQELKESNDNLRDQLNQYISDFMKYKKENESLKQKLEKIKKNEKLNNEKLNSEIK